MTDGVFGEMNVICCRNVLIYFDKTLQDQVLRKFSKACAMAVSCASANKESLNFTAVRPLFDRWIRGRESTRNVESSMRL